VVCDRNLRLINAADPAPLNLGARMRSKLQRLFCGALLVLATSVALPSTYAESGAAETSALCSGAVDLARLNRPLRRIAHRIAAGEPVTIVALGSSSTAGAGASSPERAYPARLAAELRALLPGHAVTVLNRGNNGEEVADMLVRLDRDVLAEKPDLVLWQVGTNAVLRDLDLAQVGAGIHEGLARLNGSGSEVVLIDPQYAPRVIEKPEIGGMVRLIAALAKKENVNLFPRFAVMQAWAGTNGVPVNRFVSADNLHMNDWGYDCLAKSVAAAIVDAVTRPVISAKAAIR
jgi:acyl-CoA thioesterase-1